MRRPSTHLHRLVNSIFGKSSLLQIVLFLCMSTGIGQLYAQCTTNPYLSCQFTCLNNAGEDDAGTNVGQYEVIICYDSGTPGEINQITLAAGFYDINRPEGTVYPYPIESLPHGEMVETPAGSGVYCETLIMNENQTGTISVNNDPLVSNIDIAPMSYPDTEVEGNSSICFGNELNNDYSSDAVLNIQWSVDGVDVSTDATYTHDFPEGVEESYVISVTGTDAAGCEVDASITVNVYDQSERSVIVGNQSVVCGIPDTFSIQNLLDVEDLPVAGVTWSVLDQDSMPAMSTMTTFTDITVDSVAVAFGATQDASGVDTDVVVLQAVGETAEGCDFTLLHRININSITGDLIQVVQPTPLCMGADFELEINTELFGDQASTIDATSIVWSVNGGTSTNPTDNLHATITPTDISVTNLTVGVEGTYANGCTFEHSLPISLSDISANWSISGAMQPFCGQSIEYTLNAGELDEAADFNGALTWMVLDETDAAYADVTMTAGSDFFSQTLQWSGTGENLTIRVSGETTDGCEFSVETTPIDVLELALLPVEGDTYVCGEDNVASTEYVYPIDPSTLDPGSTWELSSVECGTTYTVSDSELTMNPEMNRVEINWSAFADPAGCSTYVLSFNGSTNGGGCPIVSQTVVEYVSNPPAQSLACDNHIYVTTNNICELIVTPDMMLEGAQDPNEDKYDIEVVDTEADTIVTLPMDDRYIGKDLQVSVIEECSVNSCWGYLTIEDKTITPLECPAGPFEIACDELNVLSLTGFPVFPLAADTIRISNDIPPVWRVEDYDNCSDATLTYTDALIDQSCEPSSPGATFERTWVITDLSGNTASCSYNIEVQRPTMADMLFPLHWDDQVAGANPSIDVCQQDIPLDGIPNDYNPEGNPHPDYTGYPEGLLCMNIAIVGYEDVYHLPKCGDGSMARKIIREWTLWDACTEEDLTYSQIITLKDDRIPFLTPDFEVGNAQQLTPENIDDYPYFAEYYNEDFDHAYILEGDQYDCAAPVTLYPYPGSDKFGEYLNGGYDIDCSDFTIQVSYLPAEEGTLIPDSSLDFIKVGGLITSPTQYVTIPAVSQAVWIRYEFEDACGNVERIDALNGPGIGSVGIISFELLFNDVTRPQPVCDVYSSVTLNAETGMAFVGPYTLDDGSTDNCGIDSLAVARVDAFDGDEDWASTAKFDCDDLGENVMVFLGVWDTNGNSSSCMVEVSVKNPVTPKFTDCPKDATIDCADDRITNFATADWSSYGAPTSSDLCGSNVEVLTPVLTWTNEQCGIGKVRRGWVLKENGVEIASCYQDIRISNQQPFDEDDIIWPVNKDVTCKDGITPDELGRPSWDYDHGCVNLAVGHEDTPFQYTFDAEYCHKILREWTIIDWCNNGRKYQHTQVIKVYDNNEPEITGCQDITIDGPTNFSNCTADVDVVVNATDDCTSVNEIRWLHSIDYHNDGTIEAQNIASNDASGAYPLGTHKVTFVAEDLCGNIETCELFVTVEDDVLPTPYCLDEIVIVINPAFGRAEIWASDLDAGSYDNCVNGGDVEVSFTSLPGNLVKYYTCEDLNGARVDTFDVQLYAIDQDGNYDFCLTKVIVQDNYGYCEEGDGGTSLPNGRIAGTITTPTNQMLSNVMMHIEATMDEFPLEKMSNDGLYAFDSLMTFQNYSVYPDRNDDHRSGVSTLDILMIQRHILNIQDIDTPYALIAADANNDEKISASDIADIRKLILEKVETYPNNTSWRFVPRDYTFTNAAHPWPFAERADIANLPESPVNADFIGVKVGDVNQSLELEARGSNPLRLTFKATAQSNVVEAILIDDFKLAGTQMALDVAQPIANITSATLDLDAKHINPKSAHRGELSLSWTSTDAVELNAGDVLFTLTLEDTYEGNALLTSDNLTSEAYTIEDGLISVEQIQIISEETSTDDGFTVYQNKPNPFDETTVLGFSLPSQAYTTVSVMDITGRVIHSTSQQFNKGYNEVTISSADLNTTGILYVKVETQTHSATRKMIIIK